MVALCSPIGGITDVPFAYDPSNFAAVCSGIIRIKLSAVTRIILSADVIY
jgi:hypothetical protein